MLDSARALLLVAAHTTAIYAFLVLGISRLGRRQVAQVTSIEFVIVAVLGSAVETAMVAGNLSLPAGLVSASTLLLENRGLTELVGHWSWLRKFLLGTPVLLVSNGRLIPSHLYRIGYSEEDVMAALRERGYDRLDQVRFAVLEIDGSIGVVPMEAKLHRGAGILTANDGD